MDIQEDSPTLFITEIYQNDDSDIEDVDEEDEPIHRQPRDIEEDDEEENISDLSVNVAEPEQIGRWWSGVSTPDPLPFKGHSGFQMNMKDLSPLDYFHLMVDDKMMETIVTETNRYAAEALRDKTLKPNSRFQKWYDVTLGEMWAFFGLIIAMGLIKIDDLDDYWSIDAIYSLPLFRSVMKRNRFCLILSFLHICNNDEQLPPHDPNFDPLFKIRDFVERLRMNFQTVFQPGQNITIDEAIVAWQGPLSFKVHNPDKLKSGIKMYELCDSNTGYCCNLEFYTGKQPCSSQGVTFDVVDRLITPYVDCGRVLFVGQGYTSPDLFSYLKENGTLACGAMGLNRNNVLLKTMLPLLPNLSKKDNSTQAFTNGSLNFLHFYGNQEINILTTAHDDSSVCSTKINTASEEAVIKLKAVTDYNKYMGAVKKTDQIVKNNAFRRRTLKWWKKAFFHLFMLGVNNAYIVHKATAVKTLTPHRMFRKDLTKLLIAHLPYSCTSPQRPLDVGDNILCRLTARHFPRLIKPKPGSKKTNPQRICIVCAEPGRKPQSRYECQSCNIGLHVTPCFMLYHTEEDFKQAFSISRHRQEDQS